MRDVSLVTKKGPGGRSANAAIPCAPDIMQRLVDEADLVITGAADCGSCTAYSVYDAIELERLGRPTVVVTTTKFRPIAETMAANFGLADTRLLVLPHPLGGTDRDTLHRWADDSVDSLTSLFTGARTIAVVDDATHRSVLRQPGGAETDGSADTETWTARRSPASTRCGRSCRPTGATSSSSASTATTLSLRLRIDDASCAECVMPVRAPRTRRPRPARPDDARPAAGLDRRSSPLGGP